MENANRITQDIVDALAGVFYMFAGDGRLLRWNRYLAEITGYSNEELSAMTVYELLHEKDAQRVESLFRDLEEEEQVDATATLISRDGRSLPFYFRSTLFKDDMGEPYAVCGIGSDLRERLEYEEALLKSERYYRSLIENSYDGITVLDQDGSMRYCSPSFARMTGHSPEELIGMSAFDFIHPDDIARMTQVFLEEIENPRLNIESEFRYRHADGTWHFIEAVGHNLLEDESVRGIVVNCRDITYKREAEMALRESESRFRTITDKAGDAIVMIDAEARVVFWNPSAEKLFGYRAEEAMGQLLSDLIMPETERADFRQAISYFAGRDRAESLLETREVVSRRRDGSEIDVEVSLSSLYMDGRWHALGIARDIAARKNEERLLRAANRELEAFARTLSHDLRAPLSGAYGYAKMLHDWGEEQLDDNARKWVDEIIASLRRMEGFITSVLEYARSGLPVGKSARVDPQEVVREVLKGLEARMREHGAEVSVEGELPAVMLDGMRLFQVFSNLLDNAIKFGREGVAPRIEIAAERDGDMVLFRVSDNGVGLHEEDLQYAFDPFVRLQQDDDSPGTGVGLSIVKQAVRGWGGRVWVESVPDEGSTFSFTAPAAD